jgi:hypothetical protein
MKNFIIIMNAFVIGVVTGALWDSRMMANDEEFHDYWMKRSKRSA